MKRNLIFILLFSVFTLSAQIPAGYYDAAVGKTEAALKTALFGKIGSHTALSYADLWNAFKTTDKRPDGKVWDIYSNSTNYTFVTNQCGNYTKEGDCYNREHSFPKSWFNDATPMYTDLFHLYASDGYVNGMRSNFPFGEVGTITYKSTNEYSKLGSCSFPGYSGTVFEPANELKGDMARTYFYMVTAYENLITGWTSEHLDGKTYPGLNAWSIALLLKWHRQDPVSQKEISRNDIIHKDFQKNRNPFIYHPELAEFIWGSRKGELWSLTSAVDELKIEFTLSPNPVRNQMTISSDEPDLSYSIFNLNGQLLQENDLHGNEVISVDNLESGMYLIQLKSGNRRTVQKFIVSH